MIREDTLFLVPVLNQYDLLFKLLESVESGTLRPAKYLIVDNGQKYDALSSGWMKDPARIEVHRPHRNLGVAPSWNVGLDHGYPYTLISNDDMLFGPRTFQYAVEAADRMDHHLVYPGALGFCCFLIKQSLIEAIGRFDEDFFPAYCEDSDYLQRMSLRGFSPIPIEGDGLTHLGSASRNLSDDATRAMLDNAAAQSLQRFANKWGQDPWHLDQARSYPVNLDREYERCLRETSDINEHLPYLYSRACMVNHVTEFGVRGGLSSTAFLRAQPSKLRSYDLYPCPVVSSLLAMCGKTDFKFTQADVLSVDIEPTELLFIDTRHTYEQLRAELDRHSSKVSKYIVLHDTTTFGVTGEDGSKGLWPAVEEFEAKSPFRVTWRVENNNGLTLLERTA